MRTPYLLLALLLLPSLPARAQAPNAWINELHYDNAGADANEFVEVVLANADSFALGDFTISLYNGANGLVYNTRVLSQFSPGAAEGAYAFFQLTYPQGGIQNGPDGLALSYQDSVLQFLCYGGTFTALNGPATGQTCTDLGLAESSATPVDFSLQLAGTGLRYADFAWSGPAAASPGQRNAGQAFTTLVQFDTTSATAVEGDGAFALTLLLQNPSATAGTTVDVVLTGGDPADLGGFTAQTVTFPPASTSPETVLLALTDNTLVEPADTFTFALQSPAGGNDVTLGPAAGFVLTLLDDDLPNAWINELHYDNASVDVNEFVEVVIEDTASLDLSAFQITLYDGLTGTAYRSRTIATLPPDESITEGETVAGYSVFAWNTAGIQNGPDGLALSYQDSVLQFLCYEGAFTALDGPVAGQTCADLGLAESSTTTPPDASLQLTGIGASYTDFVWTGPATASPALVNTGQILNTVVRLDTAALAAFENDGAITLTLLLQNPSATAGTTVDVVVTGGDPADLGGFTAQTVTFPPASTDPQAVTVTLTDDATMESVETFTFTLQNPTGGKEAILGVPAQLVLTLQDDDVPNVWISEIDANQPDTDTAEFIELAGEAGIDITGYFLAFYTGANGSRYRVHEIGAFTFASEFNGFGFYVAGSNNVPERDETLGDGTTNLIQNGNPDGVALFDPTYNLVFQYAYGGTFTGNAVPPFPAVAFTPRRSATDGTLTTMGFLFTVGHPSDTAVGTDTLLATPGAPNESAFQELPVELVAFSALADGNAVTLRWETATEINNAGFEIQRREEDTFTPLGFVEGNGTTAEPQQYSYRVPDLGPGRHVFRLKQVDFDGAFAFSPEVEVNLGLATPYHLGPAYPNPFNPRTTLILTVQRQQNVTVEVFNLLGQRVRVLFDGVLEAGVPRPLTLDGSDLPSGLYLFRTRGETFTATRRATLLK